MGTQGYGNGNNDNFGDPRDQRGNNGAQPNTRGAGYPNDSRGGNAVPANGYPADRPQQVRAPDDSVPSIPEGSYPVRAVAFKFGRAGTDVEQVGVRLRITKGKFEGNTSLIWYGTFGDAAADMTIRGMRALGFRGDDVRKMDTIFEGEGQAEVEHSTYNGKTTAKVKWINGSEITMKQDMTPRELDAFANKMRGLLAARPGGEQQQKSAVAPSSQPAQQRQPDQRGQQGNLDDRNAPPPDSDMPWDGADRAQGRGTGGEGGHGGYGDQRR